MATTDIFELMLLLSILIILLSQKKSWSLSYGRKQPKLVLDSCGLIDGRIEQLMTTNVLQYQLILPDYILAELQVLADGKNSYKRLRALHGLEVARNLKQTQSARVHVTQAKSDRSVDDRLLNTCKALGATLYTTDMALIKLASVGGTPTMNINDISLQLRPTVIPGELISVFLDHKGESKNQAVGYTEHGFMVVVDTVPKYIGQQVTVKVTGTKETSSGRMIFASKQ
jgi:uncharacterized protein YacL